MARPVGARLPEDLFDRLAGADLAARAGQVIVVATVDEAGWPHFALLSYFEVVAVDRTTLRLAPYAASTTTRNMRRDGKLGLAFLDRHLAYYVKGTATPLAERMAEFPELAPLSCRVELVLADHAVEEFETDAYLAAGPLFANPAMAEMLARGERVIAALRAGEPDR
jgi:hypothetical protein